VHAKGSFSGLLAIFLLAMTSWSSACDLSCSLASRRLGCEAGQSTEAPRVPEAAASKMDMENCPHATSSAAAEKPAEAPSVTTAPCVHDACRQIAVSTPAKRAAERIQRNASLWMALPMIQPASSSPLFRLIEREDPPPKIPPLALLSASLRI